MHAATIAFVEARSFTVRPCARQIHHRGGWMTSVPWSSQLPSRLDVTVTRASLPSTVSREGHRQGGREPAADLADEEEPAGDEHQQETNGRDGIGTDAEAGSNASYNERRHRPYELGDEVGYALV